MTNSRTEDAIENLAKAVKEDFEGHRPILSFSEFFGLFRDTPERHARSSVQYIRDCFEYFGKTTIDAVWGEVTRYNLFDVDFDGRRDRLVGHERVQHEVFRLLENFVREGKINKLILLHGPNGSAKSTLVDTVMRAMETYSESEEGALYRFNWVFPNEKLASGSSIGFSGFSARTVEETDLQSFAYLEEDQIDAKIRSDLNDHPLLLIPRDRRQEILADALESNDGDFPLGDYMLHGDLSHTSRQIFDALMAAYHGDITKVLKHVQVERFYISRRYRVGAITVEPQMRVDASLRQLTVDRSLSALPSSLQNQTLFEPYGDLVDANRGIIEYDDLFKRHPDLNKYLLATSEKASVALETQILHLDMVLMATANEDYLDAYKQTPDYSSFKGRVELVRVPYLLDYTVEETIYRDQLESVAQIGHMAPHTTYVAALWAVLTRLKRPQSDLYPKSLRDVIARLSPLEKADLYALGRVPEHVAAEKGRELLAVVPDLMEEGEGTSDYEGRQGASPREMKMIILNASQNPGYDYLSPLAVFEELEELVKDASVFPFLQMKGDGDYYRHDNFIHTVRERWLDVVDQEVLDAMGLIEEGQYAALFTRYVDHVSQSLKGEKVYNKITGQYEEPDEKFMEETEELIGLDEEEDAEEFRNDIISSIAAYSIDNPGEKVDYTLVFSNLFTSMRRSFFEERQKTTRRILENFLDYFEDDSNLSSAEKEAVKTMLENLEEKYGYREDSAREAVAFLHANRYKD